jgi:heme/copper-type cytochrome/quinol oxidase subunit 2
VSSELHVPVGRPVIVTLKSIDVIHTFWVPSLHGKKDMLPGAARNCCCAPTSPAPTAASARSSADCSMR